MKHTRFHPVLNELFVDLLDCWQKKTAEILRVESSYMITMKHWEKARNICWQHPFRDMEEEIYFFKNIKSQFTGRLTYYSILYEALSFVPGDPVSMKEYWEDELKRYDRFIENNRSFIEYLEGGDTSCDEQYFLRKNMLHQPVLQSKIYDRDVQCCTSRDHLVSAFFAEKIYRQFVLSRISSC